MGGVLAAVGLTRQTQSRMVRHMDEADIKLTARYATYERMLEFLLTEKLIRTNPDKWDDIKTAIIGPNAVVAKGVIDVSDLEQIESQIQERIAAIFEKSSAWALLSLK